jgi:hypothetical protein
MDALARRFPGDRRRAPSGKSDLAVGGDCKLEGNLRPTFAHAPDVAGVSAPGLLGANADFDIDAVFGKPPMASTDNLRVRVLERGHDPRDTGCNEGVGTRRRLPVMRAGLKSDIHGCTTGERARTRKRLGLGMGPAARLRPAASNHDARVTFAAHDHGSNRWIGPSSPEPAPAKRQGKRHEMSVLGGIRNSHGNAAWLQQSLGHCATND